MDDSVTYKRLIQDIRHKLTYAPDQGEVLTQSARHAVRDVCQRMNILLFQKNLTWTKNGIYELDHTGWSFCQVTDVWLVEIHPQNRVDEQYETFVRIGKNISTYTLPNPDYWNVRNNEAVIMRFSYMPTRDSEAFPVILYEQLSDLLEAAMLWKCADYVRKDDPRRSIAPALKHEYLSMIAEQKGRLLQGLGGGNIPPYTGGPADSSSFEGNY